MTPSLQHIIVQQVRKKYSGGLQMGRHKKIERTKELQRKRHRKAKRIKARIAEAKAAAAS